MSEVQREVERETGSMSIRAGASRLRIRIGSLNLTMNMSKTRKAKERADQIVDILNMLGIARHTESRGDMREFSLSSVEVDGTEVPGVYVAAALLAALYGYRYADKLVEKLKTDESARRELLRAAKELMERYPQLDALQNPKVLREAGRLVRKYLVDRQRRRGSEAIQRALVAFAKYLHRVGELPRAEKYSDFYAALGQKINEYINRFKTNPESVPEELREVLRQLMKGRKEVWDEKRVRSHWTKARKIQDLVDDIKAIEQAAGLPAIWAMDAAERRLYRTRFAAQVLRRYAQARRSNTRELVKQQLEEILKLLRSGNVSGPTAAQYASRRGLAEVIASRIGRSWRTVARYFSDPEIRPLYEEVRRIALERAAASPAVETPEERREEVVSASPAAAVTYGVETVGATTFEKIASRYRVPTS